ncbi:MAG: nucleoside kinase [Anaerolineales bacterium]|nr:nucleoside kinase [Anaerolineales bacterium]
MNTPIDAPIQPAQPRDRILARLPDGRIFSAPPGSTLAAILKAAGVDAVGAVVNQRIVELTQVLNADTDVAPILPESTDGQRIYRRAAVVLLTTAAAELHPEAQLWIEHAAAHGRGYFCEARGRAPFTPAELAAIDSRMRAIVAEDAPFERRQVPREEAVSLMRARGQHDTARLIAGRTRETVTLYALRGRLAFSHGYLVPSAGYLRTFSLHAADGGFILSLPSHRHTGMLVAPVAAGQPSPAYQYPLLFEVFEEANNWLEKLGLRSLGALNEAIGGGRLPEIALVAEALHESRIALIATALANHADRFRVVLIAGPSSSGKTTFSKRLAVQLLANGLRPFPLGIDDYFLDRDATPTGPDGKPDFESLGAVDVALFNDHLQALLAGEAVWVPHYNFVTGKRETGHEVRLGANDVIVIEGIHGLNPALVPGLDPARVYRIYVSALAGLNLDCHNRIATTDIRLLRRIARDAATRGYSAQATLQRWPSVTEGERRNIFPYQENCDAIFNSCLPYELAVLRLIVEPLLLQVRPGTPEYVESNRLLSLLGWVRGVTTEAVPGNSILREFVGGSSLADFRLWRG